jgi:hypothetical protein
MTLSDVPLPFRKSEKKATYTVSAAPMVTTLVDSSSTTIVEIILVLLILGK